MPPPKKPKAPTKKARRTSARSTGAKAKPRPGAKPKTKASQARRAKTAASMESITARVDTGRTRKAEPRTTPSPKRGDGASLEASTVRSSMRAPTARTTRPTKPARADRRKLFLRMTFPGGDVVVFPAPDLLLFGRSDECDVVLPQTNVSRRHAEIRLTAGAFKLRDLGSTNGTFRNATRAGELEVTDGDVIQLGDVAILWEILVADEHGLRPVRDRVLVDGASRLARRREPCAFLWLARLARLRRQLGLPEHCSHLVISLPANEAVDVVGLGYEIAGDGEARTRHQLSFRLPPGDALRGALARASQESSYLPPEVDQISRGSREGRLPADLTRLGFGAEDG